MKSMRQSALLLLLIATPALAQEPIVWTGGVGEEERSEAPGEGVKLSFFVESGSYLSNVRVSIRDEDRQEVVSTVATGPWLMVNLPEGRYWVIAETDERGGQSVLINIGSGQREYGFAFPD